MLWFAATSAPACQSHTRRSARKPPYGRVKWLAMIRPTGVPTWRLQSSILWWQCRANDTTMHSRGARLYQRQLIHIQFFCCQVLIGSWALGPYVLDPDENAALQEDSRTVPMGGNIWTSSSLRRRWKEMNDPSWHSLFSCDFNTTTSCAGWHETVWFHEKRFSFTIVTLLRLLPKTRQIIVHDAIINLFKTKTFCSFTPSWITQWIVNYLHLLVHPNAIQQVPWLSTRCW